MFRILLRVLLGALALLSFVCVSSIFLNRQQMHILTLVVPFAPGGVLYGTAIAGILGSCLLLFVPARDMKIQVYRIWTPSIVLTVCALALRHHGRVTGTDLLLHASEALLVVPATAFTLWCCFKAIRSSLLRSPYEKLTPIISEEVPEVSDALNSDGTVVVYMDRFREARGK